MSSLSIRRARSDAASSRISRSSWLNADSRLLSISISPSTPFFPFIGTTISDRVVAKHEITRVLANVRDHNRRSFFSCGAADSLSYGYPNVLSLLIPCIRLQYQIFFSHEIDTYPVKVVRICSQYLH